MALSIIVYQISVMRIASLTAKCIPGAESDNFNPIHRIRMFQHGCIQGAVIVYVCAAVSGLGNVQAGTDVSAKVDAHFDEDKQKHDDDAETDAQCEIQPGLLLMHCNRNSGKCNSFDDDVTNMKQITKTRKIIHSSS